MERYFRLNNDQHIPAVGLGTWQIRDGNPAINAVLRAIEIGYRHFDTASMYGNERGIGAGIRESGVDRKGLFVTSKLWNSDRGYDQTMRAFERTMHALQLEYLDLYLIHWPATPRQHAGWKQINSETWRAMEDLHKGGRIRSIGVSNFMPHHLEPLLENAETVPAVNQVEYHPGYMQKECVSFCQSHGIQVEAWAPFGSGRMFASHTLQSLARKYKRPVAQLCVRWILQNRILPLPKSSSPERMKENLGVFDFEISGEDMRKINEMNNFGSSGQDPDLIDF